MKKYKYYNAFYMSFFLKDFYRDVARNWEGRAFGYLFIVICFCWFLNISKFQMMLSDYFTRELPKFVNQVPEINIINGKVNIDAVMPYFIKYPGNKSNLLIIDTSGKIKSMDQIKDPLTFFLLTEDKAIFRKNSGDNIYDLSKIKKFKINKEAINNFFNFFRKLFFPIAYPIAVIGLFIFHIIQTSLYGAIGIFFNKILKNDLDYKALVRLSVMSLMPVFLLSTARFIFDIHMPYLTLIGFFISMSYLYFGIKSSIR